MRMARSDVPIKESDREAVYWNRQISPNRTASSVAARLDGSAEKLRSQGITVRVNAPTGGILKGRSAGVLLNDESRGPNLVDTHRVAACPVDRTERHSRRTVSDIAHGRGGAATANTVRRALVRQSLGRLPIVSGLAATRDEYDARDAFEFDH